MKPLSFLLPLALCCAVTLRAQEFQLNESGYFNCDGRSQKETRPFPAGFLFGTPFDYFFEAAFLRARSSASYIIGVPIMMEA